MATRNSRAAREFCRGAEAYEELFASLFISGAKIDNLEQSKGYKELAPHDRPTQDYIVKTLYRNGEIAYQRSTGLWLPFSGNGHPNIYGRYPSFRLIGANGYNYGADAGDVAIIRANVNGTPLASFIKQRAALIADFDNAIAQNLDAVKQMTVILTDAQELALKIAEADRARRRGESVRVIERKDMDMSEVTTLKTEAPYIVTQLLEDRRKAFEETLHLVGVLTPTEKGERMITNEVETQNAETFAYIGIMNKTANKCCEEEELPFRFVFGDGVTRLSEDYAEEPETGAEGANTGL